MPRNGSGSYTAPSNSFNPATVNTTIDPAHWNTVRADIETAISESIARDGQTSITANLPMNSKKLTGLANGSARGDSVSLGQVQDMAFVWGGTAGGTADALTITLTPALAAYAAGQFILFKAASNNTGAATVDISSLGVKTIQNNGAALVAGDIASGKLYVIVYDGTNFQLNKLEVLQDAGGDVVGPGSSTDNTIPRYDSTTGKLIQGSGVTINDSDQMSKYFALPVVDATTARTLTAADNGAVIFFTNASAITVTLPQTSTESLAAGFNCVLIQSGAGQITVAKQGTDTIESKDSNLKSAAQHSSIGVVKRVAGSPNTWWIGGDLAA